MNKPLFPFLGLPSQVVAPRHLQAPGNCTIYYYIFYFHLFNRQCHHHWYSYRSYIYSSVKMLTHEHCNFSTAMPHI